MSTPLFQQLLGESFAELPTPLRIVHDGQSKTLHGRCDVERGTGRLSRLFAWATSLPPQGKDQPIEFIITSTHGRETWTRKFGRSSMRSSLSVQCATLVEWLGPMRFKFNLSLDHANECVHWRLAGVAVMGLPLPLRWFQHVTACESASGSKYCFDVSAALPLAGLLVRYRGWLDVT